jgi:adenylosuccinate synthase
MKIDVLLGLQWGDEGKGKIVDAITPKYDSVVRFQGGPNAGHSLEFNNIKHVLHTIPSGIFHEGSINVIGNGVVIDAAILKKEILAINKLGVDVSQRLYISKKAHLIIPTHRILDAAQENAKGTSKIGSTLKGIGPTYTDKIARNGLRIGDILSPNFIDKYNALKQKHIDLIEFLNFDFEINDLEKEWFEGIELIKSLKIIDSEYFVNNLLKDNKKILAEGAQGTMLDIDFGTYPFVTSSNTVTAGALTGIGIAPQKIGEVFGIFKAYCTRVGSGPFPTELNNEVGEELRRAGHEFGATTGRPRRCGWIDLPALKYSIMINGVTQLIMTKADVLNNFDTIKVCTAYKINGKISETIPYELSDSIEPIYKEFNGWKTNTSSLKKENELPKELINYINYLEKEFEVPITIVSLGPDRNQTIYRNK